MSYCNALSLIIVFLIMPVLTGCESHVENPVPAVQITPPKKAEFVERQTCVECHEDQYKEWLSSHHDLAMDVSCQACHGPGSNHVEWARSVEKTAFGQYEFKETGFVVDLGADDSHVQIEACARCHARRKGLRKDYLHGKPLMDYYVPQVLTDPFYYPDGQIRNEVYVYSSFVQSKKYQHGVRCTDCHNPHTARLRTYGNELCMGCHSSTPPQEFAGLEANDYNSPVHHFHKEGSPGSECIECHMPEIKHMIVDPRRDHSFQIPRPDLSVKLGIPNACNRCHKEETAEWASKKINEVHPLTKEKRQKEKHVAEFFAVGQAGKPEAVTDLIRIAGDIARPAIIRATALNILSGYRTEDAVNMTAVSLTDDEPLVRYEAVRAISELIPRVMEDDDDQEKKYSLIVPLLKDQVRAVRTEAARVLTEVPAKLFKQVHQLDFENALNEYIEWQESIADLPETHLELGMVYENMGKNDMAEASYKTFVRLVPDFTSAMFNLANFYNKTGRNKDAENQWRKIIEIEPDNGEAHYSLGLLMAETNLLDKAVESLARAVELLPDDSRVRYNYSLSLRHFGRNADALSEMIKAYEKNDRDPTIAQALVVFYIQKKEFEKALAYAEKLVQLTPGAPGPEQMLEQIKKSISAQD